MADNSTGLDMVSDTMPRQDELETYRILFELFDRDMSGFIYVQDVRAIAYKLDRDPNEGKLSNFLTGLVISLINNFDEDKDQKVSFGEFVSALWTLEKRDEEFDMFHAS
jgi:Ca2+-binding EF-hand superfamily protein